MKKISLSVSMVLSLVLLFLVTNVYAVPTTVSFDPEGNSNYEEYELFSLAAYSNSYTFNSDADHIDGDSEDKSAGDTVSGNFFSTQNQQTGDFEEHFTVRIDEGQIEGTGAPDAGFNDLFMDLNLYGNVDEAANTVSFTSGDATMYYDDGIVTDNIASLDFKSAQISSLSGSVTGDAGFGMETDLTFSFLDVNHPDYFGAEEDELAGKEWLLAFTGGSVDVENIWDNGTHNITEWEGAGDNVEFGKVPEPTTLLLFGTGLLGMAAFGRRKFMKKS